MVLKRIPPRRTNRAMSQNRDSKHPHLIQNLNINRVDDNNIRSVQKG